MRKNRAWSRAEDSREEGGGEEEDRGRREEGTVGDDTSLTFIQEMSGDKRGAGDREGR